MAVICAVVRGDGAGAAGGCLAGVLAGAGPGMAGGPYARRRGRAAPCPALMGPARPPGLARRGTRAWQVGKEPTRAAPGTYLPFYGQRRGGGARSERPVRMNHVIRPTTKAGPAGWPGIRARTARLSRAAASARRARRSGRPWRIRSGSSSSGRMLGGGRSSQPGGSGASSRLHRGEISGMPGTLLSALARFRSGRPRRLREVLGPQGWS